MAYGKAIELFLVNGTAESLITAELSNWNGKAIKIPRTEIGFWNSSQQALLQKPPSGHCLQSTKDDYYCSVYRKYGGKTLWRKI